MSALITTITVATLAEKIHRYDNPGILEVDVDAVVAVKDRLIEVAKQNHFDWNLEILTVSQAAILRDLYWYAPRTEGA